VEVLTVTEIVRRQRGDITFECDACRLRVNATTRPPGWSLVVGIARSFDICPACADRDRGAALPPHEWNALAIDLATAGLPDEADLVRELVEVFPDEEDEAR
jgi:hypothetical protein